MYTLFSSPLNYSHIVQSYTKDWLLFLTGQGQQPSFSYVYIAFFSKMFYTFINNYKAT